MAITIEKTAAGVLVAWCGNRSATIGEMATRIAELEAAMRDVERAPDIAEAQAIASIALAGSDPHLDVIRSGVTTKS